MSYVLTCLVSVSMPCYNVGAVLLACADSAVLVFINSSYKFYCSHPTLVILPPAGHRCPFIFLGNTTFPGYAVNTTSILVEFEIIFYNCQVFLPRISHLLYWDKTIFCQLISSCLFMMLSTKNIHVTISLERTGLSNLLSENHFFLKICINIK